MNKPGHHTDDIPAQAGKARMTKESLKVTMLDGSVVTIPVNEVWNLYGLCKTHMDHFGAFDMQGNALVWPQP